MSIGTRVLKKDLFRAAKGKVPLYSANVEPGKEHGWIDESNFDDFSHPSLLWSIDSDFNISVHKAAEQFATTDHSGRLEILDASLDPEYCRAAIIYGYGRTCGFDRVQRPSLKRMAKVLLRVPVRDDGTFDLEAQRDLAREYVAIGDAVQGAEESLEAIVELKARADLPSDAVDLGMRLGDADRQPSHRLRVSKEDRHDARVSLRRLAEIEVSPRKVLRGKALEKRLKQWLA
jgi:hypothetical protein